MESDVFPLQQSNSELSEKNGMLQAEKAILEEDIKRWKARTQVSLEVKEKNLRKYMECYIALMKEKINITSKQRKRNKVLFLRMSIINHVCV